MRTVCALFILVILERRVLFEIIRLTLEHVTCAMHSIYIFALEIRSPAVAGNIHKHAYCRVLCVVQTLAPVHARETTSTTTTTTPPPPRTSAFAYSRVVFDCVLCWFFGCWAAWFGQKFNTTATQRAPFFPRPPEFDNKVNAKLLFSHRVIAYLRDFSVRAPASLETDERARVSCVE